MSTAHDRRAPGTARMPFDAMVEVGGALGPSFEARALNLSEEGMSLRTTYLPEVGQPVMCRFDAGHGMTVVAAGEVLWKDDMGEGGEFGIRFTNLDAPSATALQRILGMVDEGQGPSPGHKVRLHIEGLASPMRARIKDKLATGVTAYSELGFLQMGKPLELEDAASGTRRPALIDRVEVEVDEGSRIPQLVVSLRYDDEDARAASLAAIEVPVEEAAASANEADDPPEVESAPEPAFAEAKTESDKEEIDEESDDLKKVFVRHAAKVTPALASWAKRAKLTAALLAARAARASRRTQNGTDVEIPVRRTTAPAPGGGLHAAGRKVVRGNIADDRPEEESQPRGGFAISRKKAALGGSIGIAAMVLFVVLRKSPPAPELASAPVAEAMGSAAPALTAPAVSTIAPVAPPLEPLAGATQAMTNAGASVSLSRPGKPTPFTNGPVGAHPTLIKIKMDGPVEGIHGATQPTGFTILTPNRKAVDPTTSLASKDSRLEAVRVTNEPDGAEFTVSFKDGVPNYVVRARGDTLEMVLAKARGPGKVEASAKKKTTKKAKKHH